MKLTWSTFTQNVSGKEIAKSSDSIIRELCYDSRLAASQDDLLFFAIKSERGNGHDFIPALYDKGVRCFVVEQLLEIGHYPGANFLLVHASIKCLQELGQYIVSQHKIPIVGITGSNGKTYVKEWLSTLLSEKMIVAKSPKSYNSQIGVPLSVWQLDTHHQVGVFEVGISQEGEMNALAQILRPDIGIFTNIGHAHDLGFTSLDQKILEKAKLFTNTRHIICSRSHQKIFDYLKQTFPNALVDWSTSDPQARFFYSLTGTTAKVYYAQQTYHFQLPFSFDIWIENALHAITAAIISGLSEKEIQVGLNKLKSMEMRLEIKNGLDNCYLIDDTYNNDLQGLSVALDFLKQQLQRGKKTLILSDIQQSGMSDQVLYQAINQLLVGNQINKLITIGLRIAQFKELFETPTISFDSVEAFLTNPPSFRDEMILVKGARKFALERIIGVLEAKKHRTQLEIRLESIINNLNQYKNLLTGNTKIMAMVKAFGYGGGSLEIANLLQYHRIDYLGVAYLDEAIQLRTNGIKTPIMVMNPHLEQLDSYGPFGLEPEIYNLAGLKKVLSLDNPPHIHLKIDTGMHRLGFSLEEVPLILSLIEGNSVNIAGIFTHFSSADLRSADDFTRQQAAQFELAYHQLTKHLYEKPLKYAANSTAVVRFPEYHFDMVRIGIGLYGFDPSKSLNLVAISTLKTRISQIKEVKKGDSIGYGRGCIADRNLRIATVPIGYADGYSRVLGNGHGRMKVANQLVDTIGNICMDMTMLNVTDVPCEEGETVIVFGEAPTIEDLAHWANTIPYEILTNVSQRVNRIFIA